MSPSKSAFNAEPWAESLAAELGAVRKLLVAPVAQPYPIKEGIEVVDVMTAIHLVAEQDQHKG